MPTTSEMRLLYPEFIRSWSPLICDFSTAATVEFMAGGNFGPTVKLKVHPACEEAFKALAQTFRVFNYFFHDPAGGTCVCRPITGGIRTSLHAHGVCIDINPGSNRYRHQVGLVRWGVDTDMTPQMIDAVEGIRTVGGFPIWEWGGRWSNIKDPMHFQASKCTRTQLVRGVDWTTVPGDEDTMRQGDTGTNVKKLQNYLNRWVRSRGIVEPELIEDGTFGINTTNRVKTFQTWASLDPSGLVDPITIATLTALILADKQGG